MTELTRSLAGQGEFSLSLQEYKRPKSPAPAPELEPWYRARSFSIIHEEKLTEELFSRAIAERIKPGFAYLLPFFDYFSTLDGDPDPAEANP